ncbi:FkbM family methyltransferase [Acuticoccus sp. MNP-M23]|uniref:FkbM family methyltransferase n=1 Tax=Acuticoccus sp. MNP-M23 TaxID=3072793 RepID=UPI0028156497|nr:FkbM family methyltransferase [Acuticoccus sp. MNP-M23]WMS41574.1 FkbM family methyltransferase [Acuticoccus sp. MNP-M23]
MRPPPRWLRRLPLVREPMRRFYKRIAPNGPVNVRLNGLDLALDPADNKVDFDIWYKARLDEAEERAFLAAHLKEGEWFVDIGANIGLYTVGVLAAAPGSRAVAFEPLARLRTRLATNLDRNGLADRVVIRPEAVGPAGKLTLHESRNAGRSSLVPFEGAKPGDLVEVRPLTEMLAEIEAKPAVLKIDIEGFEDQALLPYFELAPEAQWPRAIVLETLHRALWRDDCLQDLFQRGYIEAGRTAENRLLFKP